MSTITEHLEILWRNLDLYSQHYENIIIIRDFNADINHSYHARNVHNIYCYKGSNMF